jgi:hypothetical protein
MVKLEGNTNIKTTIMSQNAEKTNGKNLPYPEEAAPAAEEPAAIADSTTATVETADVAVPNISPVDDVIGPS